MVRFLPLLIFATGCSTFSTMNDGQGFADLARGTPPERESDRQAPLNPANSKDVIASFATLPFEWSAEELYGTSAIVRSNPDRPESRSPKITTPELETELISLEPAEPAHPQSPLQPLVESAVAETKVRTAVARIDGSLDPGLDAEASGQPEPAGRARQSHYVSMVNSARDLADSHWNTEDVESTIGRLHSLMRQVYDAQRLRLQNVHFCTQVRGLGDVVCLRQNNFDPNENLLVYCEVGNISVDPEFTSRDGRKRSRLSGSIAILNESSELVSEADFAAVDYLASADSKEAFVVMPTQTPATPGKYRLFLFVFDELGTKPVAAAPPVEFVIRSKKDLSQANKLY